MAKSSIDPNLLITVGAVAIGGFLVYKLFNDSGVKSITSGLGDVSQGLGIGVKGIGTGISDASTGIGQGIGEIGAGIGSPFGMIDAAFDAVTDKIRNAQIATPTVYPQGQTIQSIVGAGQGVYDMSAAQIVQNVAVSSGNVRSSSGGSRQAIVTPMYDPVSGTGVNSAGFGYSSATSLGSQGTGTGVVIQKSLSSPFGKTYI